MPLGRIYVPPPLINSGSPSPITNNGISDLKAKWENHQNSTSHNGFRKIEIKVEVKKDISSVPKWPIDDFPQNQNFPNGNAYDVKAVPTTKETLKSGAFEDLPHNPTVPNVNGNGHEMKIVPSDKDTSKPTLTFGNADKIEVRPVVNGSNKSNDHVWEEKPTEESKAIHIPIRIEVSDTNNNKNSNNEEEIDNEIIEAPEGFREENGNNEEVCNGNGVHALEEDTVNHVETDEINVALDNKVHIETVEQPSEKVITITDAPTRTPNEKSLERPGLPTSAKGLKNLGNTCYMNSIIQCLIHTRALLEFLQEYLAANQPSPNRDAQHTSTPSYKLKDGKKITMSLARLATDMWKGSSPYGNNHGVAEPSGFRSQMTTFAPKFGGFDQHDSQEFLLYALDGLHTELNRVVKKPKKENGHEEIETSSVIEPITYDDIEEPGISAEEKSRRCWVFYLNKDSSIITDMFLGQFRSTLRCSECQHESVTFEPFWVVSLPLSKDTETLLECFELFVKAETLDGDEMPTCEQCKTRRKCIKWYSFERWPEVLVVHLKRFAPSGSYRAKLTSVINTPVNYLDLRQFSSRSFMDETAVYGCYGISNHSGTLHGGHYTATCRHPYDRNNWHVYNDRCVSGTNADHVISAEAYLLFFHKMRPED